MATSYNDGGVAFGSQATNINNVAGASVAYILSNITIDDSSSTAVRYSEVGIPNGQFSKDEPMTGSATCQLAATTTKLPAKYATFTLVPIGADPATITFYLTKIGQVFDQNGIKTVPIEFRKTYG